MIKRHCFWYDGDFSDLRTFDLLNTLFASTTEPADHPTARAFLREILGLSLDECYLSEQSELEDFSAISDVGLGESEAVPDWSAAVLDKIHRTYGVSVASTRIYLVDLFALIEQARAAVRH